MATLRPVKEAAHQTEGGREASPPAGGRGRPELLVAGAYVLLSLFWTWPLVLHCAGALPVGQDGTETVWKLWWAKKAIVDLHVSPYFCTYQLFPDGISLLFSNPCLLYGVLSLPFLGADPSPPVFRIVANLWLFVTFPLAAYGVYRLGRRVAAGRLGPFVAGALFAFLPLRLAILTSVNIASVYWLPFFLLAAGAFLDAPPRTVRRGLLTGACAAGALFTSLTALLLLLLLLPFAALPPLGRALRRRGAWGELRFWAAAALPPLLAVGAILAASPPSVREKDLFRPAPREMAERLAVPPGAIAIREERSQLPRYPRIGRSRPLSPYYLGWGALAWAGVGGALLLRRKHRALPLLLGAALLLALGPTLATGGEGAPRLPLPYRLLPALGPPFSFFRTPYRFLYAASLALALLAAVAIGAARETLRGRRRFAARLARLLIAGAAIASVADYYQGRLRMVAAEPDPLFARLRLQHDRTESLLVLPAEAYHDRVRQRLQQVAADIPLALSTLTRVDFARAATIGRNDLLLGLLQDEPERIAGHRLADLRSSGVGWLAVDRAVLRTRPAWRALLDRSEARPADASEGYLLYAVPTPGGAGGSPAGRLPVEERGKRGEEGE